MTLDRAPLIVRVAALSAYLAAEISVPGVSIGLSGTGAGVVPVRWDPWFSGGSLVCALGLAAAWWSLGRALLGRTRGPALRRWWSTGFLVTVFNAAIAVGLWRFDRPWTPWLAVPLLEVRHGVWVGTVVHRHTVAGCATQSSTPGRCQSRCPSEGAHAHT